MGYSKIFFTTLNTQTKQNLPTSNSKILNPCANGTVYLKKDNATFFLCPTPMTEVKGAVRNAY
jgi:hypothetical protein